MKKEPSIFKQAFTKFMNKPWHAIVLIPAIVCCIAWFVTDDTDPIHARPLSELYLLVQLQLIVFEYIMLVIEVWIQNKKSRL